jgi:hypothetical protein
MFGVDSRHSFLHQSKLFAKLLNYQVMLRDLRLLNFATLVAPVARLTIQVIRSYDSREKRHGDFGIGWTLGIKTATFSTG